MLLARLGALLAFAVFALLSLTGCGGAGGGPNGPTFSTVTVSYQVEAGQNSTFSDAQGLLSTVLGATTILTVSNPTTGGGAVSFTSGGGFTYMPPAGLTGSDTFTFRSEIASGGSTNVLEGTVVLTLGAFFPQTMAATFITNEETPLAMGNLAPGTDPNMQTLTWTVVTPPANAAAFSLNATTGEISYTPNTNFVGDDPFTYILSNADGLVSQPGTITLQVDPINDVPSLTVSANPSVNDGSVNSIAAFATLIPGGGADEATQTAVVYTVTNDNNALFATQPAIATNGTLTFDIAGLASGTANVSVLVQDSGGTLNGGVDTSVIPVVFTITATEVNNPLVLTPSPPGPYTYFGNTMLVVPLANGLTPAGSLTDPNDLAPPDTVLAITVTQQPAEGTLVVNPDGSFTYTPVAGSRSSQTFQFTIQDSGGVVGGGVDTTDPITVNINFGGVLWWVQNNGPGPGTGTDTDPFLTIAQAETEPTRLAGDTFRIRRGDGSTAGYDTGFTLLDGDQIIGAGVALTAGPVLIEAADGMGGPTLTNTLAIAAGTHGITLGANNVVQGLTVESGADATAYAIRGDAAGALVMSDVLVNSAAGGIRLDGMTATAAVALTGLTAANGEHGIRLENGIAGSVFSCSGPVAITDSAAEGILIQNGETPVAFSGDVTVNNATTPTPGVSIQTYLALVSFTADFDILGSSTGLDVQNSVGIFTTFGGGATPSVVATGGPAILMVGNTPGGAGVSLNFDQVTANTPTNQGVQIDTTTTPFQFSNVTITDPQTLNARAFQLTDHTGSASITNLGITAPSFAVIGVELSGTGSTPVFTTPAINLVTAGSVGFDVASGHAGCTINGGSVMVAGAASEAVRIVGTAGSVFDFNGVTISAAGGPAFSATGGAGDLRVQGATTVTGNGCLPATNVGCAVDIEMPSALGLAFQAINSSGGDFGVFVRNTSNFSLVGTGVPGIGGTITGHTVAGLRFDTVAGVTLNNFSTTNSQADGIVMQNGSNFVLTNSSVIGNGDAIGEQGVSLTAVGTPVTMDTNMIMDNGHHQVSVTYLNSPGAQVVLNVMNGMIGHTAPAAAPASNGVSVSTAGDADVQATFDTVAFTNNPARGLSGGMGTTATAAGNLQMTVNTCTFSSNARAITMSNSGAGSMTFNATGNTLLDCDLDCLAVTTDANADTATIFTTLVNNTIGSAVAMVPVPGSGSDTNGILIRSLGLERATLVATGNTVQGIAAGVGFAVEAAGTEALNGFTATLTGNTVLKDPASAGDTLTLTANDVQPLCASVTGNTVIAGDGGSVVGNPFDLLASAAGGSTFTLLGTPPNSPGVELLLGNPSPPSGTDINVAGTVTVITGPCP